MYFSEDTEKLKSEYPHLEMDNRDPYFVIKASRPLSWVNLGQISSFARGAIVLSEDWGFFEHNGIDVDQIKVAVQEMIEGHRFRGASTITQQMIKNLYLSNSRTILRKLHEIILAQKVERVLSKNKILEIYLNIIEFGPGIYGIKAACYHYFKKNPSSIDPREGAFLAMLLPSPKRYYLSYKKRKLTTFARKRINAILEKMRMGKVINSSQSREYKLSRLSWER
jgi:monofunctional biosynthetic peptidoglycan transglycosylase